MVTTSLTVELLQASFLPNNSVFLSTVDSKFNCTRECLYYIQCMYVVYSIASGRCYLYETPVLSNQQSGVLDSQEYLMYQVVIQRRDGYGGVVCPTDTGYDYESTIDMCYKFHDTSLNHDDADQACKDEGALGLARLDTQEKVNFSLGLSSYGSAHINGIWSVGGEWVYPADLNPTTTPLLDWSDGQPTGENEDEFCLGVRSDGIVDLWCWVEKSYICEIAL